MKNSFLYPVVVIFVWSCSVDATSPSSSVELESTSEVMDTVEVLQDIDNKVKIWEKTDWDEHHSIEINESTEGGEVTFYYEKKNLTVIEEINYGEMGKTSLTYYMENHQLFFLKSVTLLYNAPFYYEEYFDPTQTDTITELTYFNQGHLIEFLKDPDQNEPLVKKSREARENSVFARWNELMTLSE